MPSPVTIGGGPIYGLPTLARPRGVIAPPPMTSNTTPSPFAASASGQYAAATAAWVAFNTPRSAGNGWLNNGEVLPQWIAIHLPYPFVVASYALYPWWFDSFPTRSPTAWSLQGSNDDGASWMILDSRSGETWATNTTTLTFAVTQPVGCKMFRLWITATGGNQYTGLGSFLLSGRRF